MKFLLLFLSGIGYTFYLGADSRQRYYMIWALLIGNIVLGIIGAIFLVIL